jgi:hypothetical protein
VRARVNGDGSEWEERGSREELTAGSGEGSGRTGAAGDERDEAAKGGGRRRKMAAVTTSAWLPGLEPVRWAMETSSAERLDSEARLGGGLLAARTTARRRRSSRAAAKFERKEGERGEGG